MRVRRRRMAVALAVTALLVLGIWQAGRLALNHALDQGQGRAETALRLTENALAGYLARYQSVPMLLAMTAFR